MMLNYKRTQLFLLSFLVFFPSFCLAELYSSSPYADLSKDLAIERRQEQLHPFYVGAIGGYGATTWRGLVPTKENQNMALMLSTPIKVEEAGATWGVLGGYEFTPFFAIEANYMHYTEALVHFDSISLFTFLHDGLEILTTETEMVSLMGKLMVPIPHSKMKIFSSAGVAGVHRKDIVINDWYPGPTFTIGVNYHLTEKLMGELAGNYTGGHGESQLSPVDTYFPFLYSVTVHLIYRF